MPWSSCSRAPRSPRTWRFAAARPCTSCTCHRRRATPRTSISYRSHQPREGPRPSRSSTRSASRGAWAVRKLDPLSPARGLGRPKARALSLARGPGHAGPSALEARLWSATSHPGLREAVPSARDPADAGRRHGSQPPSPKRAAFAHTLCGAGGPRIARCVHAVLRVRGPDLGHLPGFSRTHDRRPGPAALLVVAQRHSTSTAGLGQL